MLLFREVVLDYSFTVAVGDEEFFVCHHLGCAVPMQFKLAYLLLILDVPDAVFGVDTGTDYVSVINYFYFVDHCMRLNIQLHNLVCLCVKKQEQPV